MTDSAETDTNDSQLGLPSEPRKVHAIGLDWLKSFFPNLRDAGIRWSEDDAGSLAASVAYYLALSLFPMMLLLTSAFGLFLQFTHAGKKAEEQILVIVETYASPVIKQQIEEVLKQLQNQSLVSGPFGFLAATLAAIGIFAQIDRGFDKIFRIPQRKDATVRRTIYRVVKSRFLAFLMLICLGGMILMLFAASMVIAQVRSLTDSSLPSMHDVFRIFELGFAVLANAMLFTLVYRWLPKKRVRWQDAARGGLLAACIWELGREFLGVFLIGMRYSSAYGAVGSFIAILLWCYYGISIIFFGAEYVQVLQLHREKRLGILHPAATQTSLDSYLQDNDATNDFEESATEMSDMVESRLRPELEQDASAPKQRPRRSAI